MPRSWAVRVLILYLLLPIHSGCVEGKGNDRQQAVASAETEGVLRSWMGRFGRKEEGLRRLLTAQRGWDDLRAMKLFEAVQSFEGSNLAADQLGAARSHLAFADLFERLDRLFLEAEGDYLEAKEDGADPHDRARRAFVRLRRGDSAGALEELREEAPPGSMFVWSLGRLGATVVGRDPGRLDAVQRAAAPPATPGERQLDRVCRYLWGLPPSAASGDGTYGDAVGLLENGDLVGAVMTLQLLDFSASPTGAEPRLFLYPLLRRAFASLALSAAGRVDSAAGRFYAGLALEHLDKHERAVETFRAVTDAPAKEDDAAWLYSPYFGGGETAQLAQVGRGAALVRSGRAEDGAAVWEGLQPSAATAFSRLSLALAQGTLGGGKPPARAVKAAEEALREITATPAQLPTGAEGERLAELYAARVAAACQLAARLYWAGEGEWKALDIMERAHRKSGGYRPDFANPPSFMVDLARARFEAGQYAAAVSVLFELAGEFPSARQAYESMKRLYASQTGGDVPPR